MSVPPCTTIDLSTARRKRRATDPLNRWCRRMPSEYLSLPLYLSISPSLSFSPPSIYLSLSIYLSIYLSIHPAIYPSISPSTYLSIQLSIYLSICLSLSLSLYLSTYLSIHPSIHLSISLPLSAGPPQIGGVGGTRALAHSIYYLVGGFLTPLKNISQLGWLFLTYGKIKNVPNHQPVQMMFPSKMSIHRGALFLCWLTKRSLRLEPPSDPFFVLPSDPWAPLPYLSIPSGCPAPLIKVDALLGDLSVDRINIRREAKKAPSDFSATHLLNQAVSSWDITKLTRGNVAHYVLANVVESATKLARESIPKSMSTLVQVGAPWLVYGDYNYIPIRYYKHVSTTYN